jgi:hypothetical protein
LLQVWLLFIVIIITAIYTGWRIGGFLGVWLFGKVCFRQPTNSVRQSISKSIKPKKKRYTPYVGGVQRLGLPRIDLGSGRYLYDKKIGEDNG